MVEKFYEAFYGGWNNPARGKSSIVNETRVWPPHLWIKLPAAAGAEPPECLPPKFLAPKVVVRQLSDSVVKDVQARNSEEPEASTSGSSRTSRSTANKRLRGEESSSSSGRKKLKRSCTTTRSTSSEISSEIVNLSDEVLSSDSENTALKNVRNTNISNNFCLQINFVIKYTFLLHYISISITFR
jgi:hypothetical protein